MAGRATLTIKSRPLASGQVSWSLWIRRPRPESDELIPVPNLSKLSDRPAVEAFAKPFRDALAKGLSAPQPETCDEWYERYHAYQLELGHTGSTRKRMLWVKWIAPYIGKKRPDAVTRDDIENIRDALDKAIQDWSPGKSARKSTCLSGKTAMNAWSCLTSSFKAATASKRRDLRVLDGKQNPCVGVLAPGDKDSRKTRRKTFLYPREASALLACADVPREWREVYALALYTYLRPGEIRVLTWADVDEASGVIHVSKAWDYADEKVKKPKTRNGVRTVPIEPSLLPLLKRMLEGKKPSEQLTHCLEQHGENHIALLFRKHLEAAGVKRPALHGSTHTHVQANFRSCRDSGITWLAMSGLGVDKIMRRAGHDMVQTTMGYVKQTEDLTGDLGVPFAPLPESLTGVCEPPVNSEPPVPVSARDHEPKQRELVARGGFEPPTFGL